MPRPAPPEKRPGRAPGRGRRNTHPPPAAGPPHPPPVAAHVAGRSLVGLFEADTNRLLDVAAPRPPPGLTRAAGHAPEDRVEEVGEAAPEEIPQIPHLHAHSPRRPGHPLRPTDGSRSGPCALIRT